MKKTVLGIVALCAMGITIQACKKETVAEVPAGTATVEGYIRLNSNLRNDTLPDGSYETKYEGLPTHVNIQFVIDSKDLQIKPSNNYNYDLITKTVKVDANGKYSVSLPVPANGKEIEGEIRIDGFEFRPILTSSQNTDSLGERVTMSNKTDNFYIYNGGKTIYDFNY